MANVIKSDFLARLQAKFGMLEKLANSQSLLQVLVLDHDAQAQGYGKTGLEQIEVRPLSELKV